MTGDGGQGDSFGRVAHDYARTRPSYPSGAFAHLIERLPAGVPLAVDVAAGTGLASAALPWAGTRVVAVEPDLAMLRRAATGPGPREGFVRAVAGRAERLPVRTGVVDLVIAAQAFHWFEAARALDEFARVLRPGGFVALVWNVVEADAFVSAVRSWIRRRIDDVEIPVTNAMREVPESLVDHPAFDLETTREIARERTMDSDRYVAYAFSWSYCGGAIAPRDREPIERELRELVDRHHGTSTWRERLVTVVHSARRRRPRPGGADSADRAQRVRSGDGRR